MRTGKGLLCYRVSKHCLIESIISIKADDSVVAIHFVLISPIVCRFYVYFWLCASVLDLLAICTVTVSSLRKRELVVLISPIVCRLYVYFWFCASVLGLLAICTVTISSLRKRVLVVLFNFILLYYFLRLCYPQSCTSFSWIHRLFCAHECGVSWS